MSELSQDLISQCKAKLLQTKTQMLSRVREVRMGLHIEEKGGDEADQTLRVLAEKEVLALHDRMLELLVEVESALARIQSGSYGVCEETEENIEPQRLLAIPWTRLSIEGAEIRESRQKRYAR